MGLLRRFDYGISWTIPSINTCTTPQAASDPLGASPAMGLKWLLEVNYSPR